MQNYDRAEVKHKFFCLSIAMIDNVFVPQKKSDMEPNSDDISGKITYTNIIESLPETHRIEPMDNWREQGLTEWRWRFLDIEGRKVVEISGLRPNENQRLYFNKHCQWIKRDVDPVFDKYVKEVYYCYANE